MEIDSKVRELQLRELDILLETIKIMDKIGVKYYLSAGTLLGAVRHNGFIPWDDDIDIMLTRDDYEIFLKRVKSYLPDHLLLLHYKERYSEDEKEEMDFRIISATKAAIQILDKRYSVTKRMWSKERTQKIWIDIVALDKIPDNPISFFFYKNRLMFLHRLVEISRLEFKPDNHKSASIVAGFALKLNRITHFSKLIHPYKVIERTDRILKENSAKKYKRYINFMGEYKFKEVVPVTFLGRDTYMDFEGTKMRVPENYDVYLKAIYGDYMKLPPEEKRVCKHIISVD